MAATPPPLLGRLLAEPLGAALLAAVVIASGIAAQKLSPDDVALRLLETAAIGPELFAIILMFRAVSGGHPHPLVSVADLPFGGIRWREAPCHRLLAKADRVLAARPEPSHGT